ncbi:MAG: response regulator transcription factor [Chloroflexi bacterium]|nr:response regulator transcription factor [Chloroflexota bacterium]
MFREGVRRLLESQPDIEVIGEASDGQEAIDKTHLLKPDIVLLDISMPAVSGLEACQRIKERDPEVKTLALTVHDSHDYFFRILEAGASGYLLKEATSEELVAALKAVARGGVYLYPTIAKKLVKDYLYRVGTGEERASYDGLTDREREVLKLIAEGRSNQDIADQLYLSHHTVQTHRARIMEKLNLHSRAELVKYALRKGLIEMDT